MRHLDLCTGIGGFSLAAEWCGISTVGMCDISSWCRDLLAVNFPHVPQIKDDVKDLIGDEFGAIDILSAGYPCQPFSLAGRRSGANDERHIWPHILRVIKKSRPAWVVLENVRGHVSMGLDDVSSDLEGAGYAVRSYLIPASSKEAKHRRERLWIIASMSNSPCCDVSKCAEKQVSGLPKLQVEFGRMGETVGIRANKSEPFICGAFDGVREELDIDRKERLTALGNAIIPHIAYEIFRSIVAVEKQLNA